MTEPVYTPPGQDPTGRPGGPPPPPPQPATKRPNYMHGEYPRRCQVPCWIPVEKKAHDLIAEIEELGCDTRLTNAQVLLHQVCDNLADWAEETGNVLPATERVPAEPQESE